IGIISRLYEAKGIDLVTEAFKELMELDIQMILLGTGDKKFYAFFEKMMQKYGDKFACYLGFNDELAHLITGGADMLLMPSRYEPCGLTQMYSLVYGTVPIVRETGGLADTVVKYDEKTGDGTGFMFTQYNAASMVKEIKRALKTYNDKKIWLKIVKSGMKSDFSWNSSAKKYVELYKTMLNGI
ncbi:MAG: glycogen synthase, partial [Ignavibacteria bacterium]